MTDARHTIAIAVPPPRGHQTAAEKVAETLRQISMPDEGAGELELTFATMAMALERGLGEELDRAQETGELDRFMLQLTRWLATHRSDSADQLLVVEVPRRPIPTGTCVHLMEQAVRASESATSPL